MSDARPLSLARVRAVACVGAAVVALGCAGRGERAERPFTTRLAALGPVRRTFAPRLSIAQAYAACGGDDRALAACAAGGPPPSNAALAAVVAAVTRATRGADADALHARALVDLVWSDDGATLDRSIATLATAARLAERPAPVLTDYVAALLVRAGQRGAARDLIEAVEVADVALHADPVSAPAAFDLALALTRLGLAEEASTAWSDFLLIEPRGPWADEARARRAELASVMPPRFDTTATDVRAAVAEAPQEARLYGWTAALGAWGTAVLKGDTARARAALGRARAVGAALEGRDGDCTLADAVRTIDGARGAPLSALAEGHRAFARGSALYTSFQFAPAAAEFRRAAVMSGPLALWARAFLGATQLYAGRGAVATGLLREVIERADATRYPALVGRTQWMLGTTDARTGQTERGLRTLRNAVENLRRAGELEHVGGALTALASAASTLGEWRVATDAARDALAALGRYRASTWRYSAVYMAALAAEHEGFPEAARRAQREAVRAAERTGDATLIAEARAAQARLSQARLATSSATDTAERAAAIADLRAARATLGAIPDSVMRVWTVAEIRVAESMLGAPGARPPSLGGVDSAVMLFERPVLPDRLVAALLARAELRTRAGDGAGARTDLERAVALIAALQHRTRAAPLRASLIATARQTVNRAVMQHVAAGAPVAALATLELGRSGLAPFAASRDSARSYVPRPRAAPGEVALVYALVGDTLVTWSVRDTVVAMVRATLPHERLARVVARARAALEARADDAARDELARLYDWLIRPVGATLGDSGTRILLVPDGALAGVPFAALRDTSRRRYFIEDYTLRTAPTLASAAAPGGTALPAASTAVLVADPAFDRRAYPSLLPLAGARREVAAVARLYPDATVIRGADARVERVIGALRHAAIVHYAGHAVVDDERPERSELVLASAAGGGRSDATLRSDRIAALDLRGVRLVVLSACETLQTPAGVQDGVASLAWTFLAAGAGGVVGTLWRVDDAATEKLMVAFHQQYVRRRDAAVALREAQLQLLRGEDVSLRTPAAWSGVHYFGR